LLASAFYTKLFSAGSEKTSHHGRSASDEFREAFSAPRITGGVALTGRR
jgi:hypothetical protein